MSFRTPFAAPASRTRLGWVAMAVAWFGTLAFAANNAVLGDEWVHWHQIARFLAGDARVFDEYLTNVPGYHWLMTWLLRAFGGESLAAARSLNAGLALAGLFAFHGLRRTLHPSDAQRATAQLMLLPVLFPFCFLVYTDAPALALLLGATWAWARERHGWAAVALVGSMTIRQNHVFWAGVLALLSLWPLWRAAGVMPWRTWRESLRIAWPYGMAVGVFLAYWAWNGSISYSRAQGENAHPDLQFDVGNVYYLLFLAACLLPLHLLIGLRRFVAAARARPLFWLWPVAAFALYAAAFRVQHPYNVFAGEYFLRNTLLQTVAAQTGPWLGFGALATLAACGLAQTRFVRAEMRWLLPLSLLFVSASWLIETRYTIVPLAMLLALREPENPWVERLTLSWWILLSAWVAVGIFDFRFMI